MSVGRRYLLGVAAVAAAGAVAVLIVPAALRPEVIWGAATGLVLQVPLGWWALRSLGTDHFMVSWGLGMLVRFTVVGVAGFAVLPATGRSPGPMLGAMVGVLIALLFVEGLTAAREHSGEDRR